MAQAITTGRRYGMQQMDHALLALVKAGDVDPDHAYLLANDKAEFAPHVSDPETAASLFLD